MGSLELETGADPADLNQLVIGEGEQLTLDGEAIEVGNELEAEITRFLENLGSTATSEVVEQ